MKRIEKVIKHENIDKKVLAAIFKDLGGIESVDDGDIIEYLDVSIYIKKRYDKIGLTVISKDWLNLEEDYYSYNRKTKRYSFIGSKIYY